MRRPFARCSPAACLLLALAVLVLPRIAFADPLPPSAESSSATTASPTVRVNTVNGNARVIAWNRSEVKVTGGTLTVSADRARAEVHAYSNNVEVHVPSASRLDVHTVAGGVTVSDVAGAVRTTAVNGDVRVSGA